GYDKSVFSERHELLGLHGSVSMRGDPLLHLHVALGRPDHGVIGGHLFRAKTAVVTKFKSPDSTESTSTDGSTRRPGCGNSCSIDARRTGGRTPLLPGRPVQVPLFFRLLAELTIVVLA